MSPIIDRKLRSKLQLLEEQLASLNSSIQEFARDHDMEGQVEYLELLNQREQVQIRISQILSEWDKNRDPVVAKSPSRVVHGALIKLKEGVSEYMAKVVEQPSVFSTDRYISLGSPLGRALLGRAPGELVQVATPAGTKQVEILAVMG